MSYLINNIVNTVISPETNEQLSVGIILPDDEKTLSRYSENKPMTLKSIYAEEECNFFVELTKGMIDDNTTEQGLYCLNRCGDDPLAVSRLVNAEFPLTDESSGWTPAQLIDRKVRHTT